MNITTKRQMYELYTAGTFGNRLRHWASVEEYLADSWSGLVGLRCLIPNSPYFQTRLHRDWVVPTIADWCAQDSRLSPNLFIVSESDRPEWRRLNAEVVQTRRSFELRYSLLQAPMREALALESRWAHLAAATAILRSRLDGASWENLERLLEAYPGHVIELTAFDRAVGWLNENTVIWEVRNY